MIAPSPPTLPLALMVQGTSSNCGKSLLAAALCRICTRHGLRTAPFKAQNMSLNSFVTANGEEMARAQVLQAAACGLDADVRMNPILLKPTTNYGSQVLLLGKPAGHLHARDFLTKKNLFWPYVQEAYQSLASEYELMILEGAGSPAEINLRKNDIVNMRMAQFAHARVLLTADIDRGGAFAALVGTVQLLKPFERKLVAGFLLNKFRGEESLLQPAIEEVSRRTKKPFLATVPWINDLTLPEEDSVAWKNTATSATVPPALKRTAVDIAIIDLPHISNTTDFDALAKETNVSLRLIRNAQSFGTPSCVILPGTRAAIKDLHFLRSSGLDLALHSYAKLIFKNKKGLLLGICGGFQILGQTIHDPLGLEGEDTAPTMGLDLLSVATVLEQQKILARTTAQAIPPFTATEMPLQGYEIHHGKTTPLSQDVTPLFAPPNDLLGFGYKDMNGTIRILGTYLHGLFDNALFRADFCNRLRKEEQLAVCPPTTYLLNHELDRIADVVEDVLPFTRILDLLGRKH